MLSKFLRKQLYFSFINCHLNYANIAWASTNKSNLQALCRHQKHAARIINFKDKFTSAKPLFEQINTMTVDQMNIFRHSTLCIFEKIETHRQFLNTFIRQNQLTNTQQDLKIYCSNHYVRKTLQNLS